VLFSCQQKLDADDIAEAVVYILSAKPHVQVVIMRTKSDHSTVRNENEQLFLNRYDDDDADDDEHPNSFAICAPNPN